MKKIRNIFSPFLIVAITLLFVAGYGFIKRENIALAASDNKKITVKAASDFTLNLPKNWANRSDETVFSMQ